MNLRSLVAGLLLFGIAGASIPARSQAVVPTPCEVYLCMAGLSGAGASGGPGCTMAVTYWHSPTPAGLAVYTTFGFSSTASYGVRQAYLAACVGSNSTPQNIAVTTAILNTWGHIP